MRPPPIDGAQPIAFSPDTDRRMREYHLRRRHIDLMASLKDLTESGRSDAPFNDPSRFGPLMTMQAKAQAGARKELRGKSVTYETEPWMEYVVQNSGWGYVVYKTSHVHSDAQWSKFIKRFEADTGNWGHGLNNITKIRGLSKMHWIDGDDVGNTNPSLKDLKSIPGGDVGPFIKAVDAVFDRHDLAFRSDESPGFDGTLRVLGSLVWDDVGALSLTQTQGLAELWPLAMEHPLEIYVGPVVQKQANAWRTMGKTDRQALKKWIKGVREDEEEKAKIIRDEL
ncbi:hypothetical protein PG987_014264 [Apiospora arundinis]